MNKSLSVLEIESAIIDESTPIDDRRSTFRQWLFQYCGLPTDSGSIGDALGEINSQGIISAELSALLIRSLRISGLLPSANSSNQIERHVVEICENSSGDLCSFLKLNPKDQNFKKFAILEDAHATLCAPLSPLKEMYGDIGALLAARREILGSLNHSIVRQYCTPFGLNELKSATEIMFSKLTKMVDLDSSFLEDYEEARRSQVVATNAANASNSFLSEEYFKPLFQTSVALTDEFIESVRRQYSSEIKKAWGADGSIAKGYPLHEVGRKFPLILHLQCEGNGFSEDVRVTAITDSSQIDMSEAAVLMGRINPGQFSVVFEATVLEESSGFSGVLEVLWREIGKAEPRISEFDFHVRAQSRDVEWQALEFLSPYSTEIAEGDKFIGREDLVKGLAGKILRDPMEPFYITGQKRVGKTSLALAAAEFASDNSVNCEIQTHYILWGDVAHADPVQSLKSLGESIEAFVNDNLPRESALPPSDYNGSLSPLGSLANHALKVAPQSRFVIIIDEFDEFPQELYLKGNLAETFFANLRSLSRKKNVCLVLVGGENMPYVMDRQGQKLNNFARANLSYFSRESEWVDFQNLVRTPTDGILRWHEDAISKVHQLSNGNPYFAKILCASVFRAAVSERDTDVTAREVDYANDDIVATLGSNSFAHLWQDGIPKPIDEREPEILRRSRALVAAARTLRDAPVVTLETLDSHSQSMTISIEELRASFNDFVQRNVVTEAAGAYRFVLPIFEKWLVDHGAQQLISDTLSEELAASAIAAELASAVKPSEIVELTKAWSTYRGQLVGTEAVQSWLQQVDSNIDRRILFKLLSRLKFVSEASIREKLQQAFSFVRRDIPVPVQRTKNERRSDILVTYVDGEGKSGAQYANMFADENRISADCIVSKSSFGDEFAATQEKSRINAVVIIDDLVATGDSLSENVRAFVEKHRELLGEVKIRVISLLSTSNGNKKIVRDFGKIADVDLDFRSCEILDPVHQALPQDMSGFSDSGEWERAKALVTDLGSKIDKRRPLVFAT